MGRPGTRSSPLDEAESQVQKRGRHPLQLTPPGRPAPAAVFPSSALTCRPCRLGHPAKPLRGCGAVCWLPSQRPVRDTRLSSSDASVWLVPLKCAHPRRAEVFLSLCFKTNYMTR